MVAGIRLAPGSVAAFVAVVVLTVAGAGAYLFVEHRSAQDAIRRSPSVATVDIATIQSRPRIVFRSNSRAHFGVVAMVALADPSGPRGFSSTACTRVYATPATTLCLSLDRIAVIYKAELLDDQFHPVRELPLNGIPSRARLSADGSLASTTAFTNVGDSYTSTAFSTRAYISRNGGASVSLEDLQLVQNGRKISPVDRNYWGVTFAADDNTFYATVLFGGKTWLVRGDLRARTVTTVREDAECPSLSPDGTHLVYKKRDGHAAGVWRLTALNLATGVETPLAETRSVDDQVEWLDDDQVMYSLPGSDGDPDISDVWAVPADGTGTAKVLIRQASSPAVVR